MRNGTISHDNNFDLIRLAASAQVAVVHVVEHLKVPHEAGMALLGFLPGVPIFFLCPAFWSLAPWSGRLRLPAFSASACCAYILH